MTLERDRERMDDNGTYPTYVQFAYVDAYACLFVCIYIIYVLIYHAHVYLPMLSIYLFDLIWLIFY